MFDKTSSFSRIHLSPLKQARFSNKGSSSSLDVQDGGEELPKCPLRVAIAVGKLRTTPHSTLIGATSAFAMDIELLKQDIRDFSDHTSLTIRQYIFPSSTVFLRLRDTSHTPGRRLRQALGYMVANRSTINC